MTEDAQFTHAHMVRFERLLPGPAEKVWSVLTDVRTLLGRYGGGIEPRTGSHSSTCPCWSVSCD